jgi:hypothetical protein
MVRIQQPTLTEVWNPGAIDSNATMDVSALLSRLTDGSKEWTDGTSALTISVTVVDPTLAEPTGRTPVGGREWYLDSGAGSHICCSHEYKMDYKSTAQVALTGISSQHYNHTAWAIYQYCSLWTRVSHPVICLMCYLCLLCCFCS